FSLMGTLLGILKGMILSVEVGGGGGGGGGGLSSTAIVADFEIRVYGEGGELRQKEGSWERF
ncbi:hypothetical protein Tco_1157953, partial [Tanacetum coccineum]